MRKPEHRGAIKVLHVSTPTSWRGGEQQLAYLILALGQSHVEQHVLCRRGSAMERWCRDHGIPFTSTPRRASFDLSFAQRIRAICDDLGVAVVHAHDSHAHSFAVWAAVLFDNRAVVVVSRRVDTPVSDNVLSRIKYNHARVARILCVSEEIRRITAQAVQDQHRVVNVYSGVDISRFAGKASTGILHREYQLPDDCRLVANVAALAPHKDLPTFVAVAEKLLQADRRYRFVLIGEGDERGVLEELIKSKNLEDRVFLTGFRSDIPDVLPEVDLLLVTSQTEGLGTSILDAFACKVPVVATHAGGIPELVLHERTGLLAPVKDVDALARCVDRVFGDHALRARLVHHASRHLTAFSQSATAEATLAQYRAVLGTSA